MFRFDWEGRVRFMWMIFTQTWRWCLCATRYYARWGRVFFTITFVCMRWRLFTQTSVYLRRKQKLKKCFCRLSIRFNEIQWIDCTKPNFACIGTYLHMLSQWRRMSIRFITAAHSAIVRFVWRMHMGMFLSIRWIGKSSVTSLMFTFKRLLTWNLKTKHEYFCKKKKTIDLRIRKFFGRKENLWSCRRSALLRTKIIYC